MSVLYESSEGVAVLTLNRPDKLNALSAEMVQRYGELLRAADADPEVRAIVVTGSGRGFCAGADLTRLGGDRDELRAGARRHGTVPSIPARIGTPVIAAVNGVTVGMGYSIAAFADVRIAAQSATFAAVFPRLGLVAEHGLSWMLPRLVGGSGAADLLLSGRSIDAAEALRLGLVATVVPDEQLRSAAVDYAGDLAANCSPSSMATIKAQLYADVDRGLDEAVPAALDAMDASFDRPDLTEALTARFERRAPRFAPRPD